jgi:Domain of unknown function (DUF4145)
MNQRQNPSLAPEASTPWNLAQELPKKEWTCGYCGLAVGGSVGYGHRPPPAQPIQLGRKGVPQQEAPITSAGAVYLCPRCDRPTYFEGEKQVPGAAYGHRVEKLPPNVDGLYAEARNCIVVNAYTASVMACRKLLMNVAVANGAPEGKHFIEYIEYLAKNGYVPPKGGGWIDHIRKRGNEATHEIALMERNDAEELLVFVEMLLKFVFEFPARVPETAP